MEKYTNTDTGKDIDKCMLWTLITLLLAFLTYGALYLLITYAGD